MARPRKTAEDLVPEENPLGELADAEETGATPEAEADAATSEAAAPEGEAAPEVGEEPVAGAPADEATAEEPSEESAAEAVSEEPAAEEPPVEEAAAETPVPEEPGAEQPADEEPSAAESAVEETAAEAPADEPVAEEPASTEEPAAPPAAAVAPGKPRKTRAERKARVRPKRRGATAGTGERKPIVRLPKPEHERGQRKERRGIVVSSAMDKTIVVRVDTAKPDRRYKKVVRRSTKFHAHDERNEANVGDVVRIVETRPLSKTKTWRLVEVVEAAR